MCGNTSSHISNHNHNNNGGNGSSSRRAAAMAMEVGMGSLEWEWVRACVRSQSGGWAWGHEQRWDDANEGGGHGTNRDVNDNANGGGDNERG